jgi:hypothetical protein
MTADELTLVDGFYRGPVHQWETDLYGYRLASGYGDLIANNMKRIIADQDRSLWAYNCLHECFDLLKAGIRWPDYINDQIPPDRQCRSRFESWLNKMKFRAAKRLNIKTTCKYRWQGDMTRDCYIYFLACAIELDKIVDISIPWYLYRGAVWKWHRYLKDPTEKNWVKWRMAENRAAIFKVKGFVNELRQHRYDAAQKVEFKD